MCDKCRAGQMVEYERTMKNAGKLAKIIGARCDRCGYTRLDSDDDVWSIVGL
jgi:predicted nucleic-acid-binding Zn-ribbon protein